MSYPQLTFLYNLGLRFLEAGRDVKASREE